MVLYIGTGHKPDRFPKPVRFFLDKEKEIYGIYVRNCRIAQRWQIDTV